MTVCTSASSSDLHSHESVLNWWLFQLLLLYQNLSWICNSGEVSSVILFRFVGYRGYG